jgi:lipopolysaccharide/colanic/teichoic acid biosynthesis glycosyltransferase
MTPSGRHAPTLLFLGDIVVFALALWLTLFFRYLTLPGELLLVDHFAAFSPLFALWVLVFYMAGLYGKRVVLFKSRLFGIILRIQIVNIVLAALVFFFTPGIALQPKTNLILYLIISLGLILAWRLFIFPRVTKPASRERAVLIGEGKEARELMEEVNGNARYSMEFVMVASPAEVVADVAGFKERLKEEGVSMLVVDTEQEALQSALPHIYELSFVSPGYQFVDFYQLYEEVFDRVPLSLLQYDWFLKNISTTTSVFYPFAKRCIDIAGGLAMGLVCLLTLPFVWVAMRLEGPGSVFITQERIGRFGAKVLVYKLRSMRFSDSGKWAGEGENKVTRVGNFLRKTSLDEFPQFINILKGELSLIGPRNDIKDLGVRLGSAIPYYNIRYIVPPGITGWAQINQQYEQGTISPQSIEETKVRLAYDFYYIKNRSFTLDVVIALKTAKRMFFRVSNW